MKFAVLSDIHYISRQMQLDKSDRELALQTAVSEKAVMDAASTPEVEFVLITGDLTDRGDKPGHDDFVSYLRTVSEKTGKKIYVLTATHDFNHGKLYTRKYGDTPAEFKSAPWNKPFFDIQKELFREDVKDEYRYWSESECTPALSEAYSLFELWDLYRDFGRDDAVSVCDEGYSYCLSLSENVLCLMLNDSYRNIEATGNQSPTYSPACLKWIHEIVQKARQENKFVFACTHHPLLPPAPAYRLGTSDRNMRSSRVGHTLADLGIGLVFSGHTHFSDVGFMTSDRGNILCDITTPSVRFYPPRYRLIDLDEKNHTVSYQCVTVGVPEGFHITERSLEEHYKIKMYQEYERKILRLKPPLNKILMDATLGQLAFFSSPNFRLTKEEYRKLKDVRVFDFVIEAAFHMLAGDGSFTPDTPEYKLAMSVSSVLDSIIDAQPFYDIRRKKLGGYSVKQIMEPMLFNNYAPDNEGTLDFTVLPEKKHDCPIPDDNTGERLMLLLCMLTVFLSTNVIPFAAAVGLPAATLAKRLRLRKDPPKAERY